MGAYILRRLLLMIPTLVGIMAINFVIIQFAPGGPVERVIAQLQGTDVSATSRISGGGSDMLGGGTIPPVAAALHRLTRSAPNIAALKVLIPNSLPSWKRNSALTSRHLSGS